MPSGRRGHRAGTHPWPALFGVANDATVKRAHGSPSRAKRTCAPKSCPRKSLPIIYLVDSAVYLPMQDEIFPDKEHFGRMFRNNTVFLSWDSSDCRRDGQLRGRWCYLPIMSDESIIVEGSGSIFLAGSYLVKRPLAKPSTTKRWAVRPLTMKSVA